MVEIQSEQNEEILTEQLSSKLFLKRDTHLQLGLLLEVTEH